MQIRPLTSTPRSACEFGDLRPRPTERQTTWRTRAKAALNRNLSHEPASVPSPTKTPPRQSEVAPHATNGAQAYESSRTLQPTILVAHSDEEMLGSICAQLRMDGFAIVPVESGPETISRVRMLHPALIVLDLALPGVSGLDVCRLLKADPLTSEIQIILLSGNDNVVDRLVGFEIGVDDYVPTPCNLRELTLRAKAVMRRTLGWQDRRSTSVGSIFINHAQCTVLVGGQRVNLTATEFRLLALLAGRAGIVQSRDTVLSEIWGDKDPIDPRSIDTYFRRLRVKLGQAAGHLKTVRGIGYRLTT